MVLNTCSTLCLPWCLDMTFWCNRCWYRCTNTQFILNTTVTEWYTGTSIQWIIFTTIIICIKEFFKPLEKFKIILETTFNQFINWNYLKENKTKQIGIVWKKNVKIISWHEIWLTNCWLVLKCTHWFRCREAIVNDNWRFFNWHLLPYAHVGCVNVNENWFLSLDFSKKVQSKVDLFFAC